jgi:EAL domain-containing protein (putative c-di-GMP-specific phosphodiesterase class I)
MDASADFSQRAQDWARAIEQTLATRSQLTRHGMLLVFGLIALVCTALLVEALIAEKAMPYRGAALMLVLSLGALAWLWRRPHIPPALVLALCAAVVANHLLGVHLNGVRALFLISPLVVMVHLLVNPLPAGVLAGLLIAGAQVIVWLAHPQIPAELWLRVNGINLGLLVILQLVCRYWRGISLRFQEIGREMVDAQLGTERAVRQSQAERDNALYTDPSSGLPNRAGFERALIERFARPGSRAHAAIVAWEFPGAATAALGKQKALPLAAQLALTRLSRKDDLTELIAVDEAGPCLALVSGPEGGEPRWVAHVQDWLLASHENGSAAEADPRQTVAGFSVWPEDGVDVQTLVHRAELARDMARSLGTAQPLRYEPDMEERSQRQARLLGDIEAGLVRGEFELHYQPIVSSSGGALHKAEALIRWNHPVRGRISPGEFIPVAEQSYLIVELTDKILEMAASQVRQWRQVLHPEFQISVNMPPAYLAKCARHPSQMLPRLQALRAPPQGIVLEITEGALLTVDDEMMGALQFMRDQGFLIALDDFGIGYSSFSKLPRLPLDFLKLDKSFVDALERGAAAEAICHTIVSLSHDLGMQVVAEGVESQAQRMQLERIGTDFFQGYLFSRPRAAHDFAAWAQGPVAPQVTPLAAV